MATDFWGQFQPYEDGGVTGRTYDPSQLQVQGTPGLPWDADPANPNRITTMPVYGSGAQMPPGGFTPINDPGGGVIYNPGPYSASNPAYNNTGINGGAISQGTQVQPAGAQDPQAFFNQLFPGDTLTPDMLSQNEAALKAQGITLVRNAAGVPGKIKLPNGQVVDVIQGAGAGLNKKQWLTGDTGAASGTLGGLGYGSFVSPIGEFTPPTAEDALNSPGLQFALDEANRMGQNNAAARGTLLNGRFQQALGASNIQNALQGYGDVYNRAANTFGINFGVKTRNQDAPYSKFLSLAQLGQQAAGAS